MPIRIMHVVDTLGKGGLENGLVNLITQLDANRFEHTVLAIRDLGPNAERLPRERVRVLCLGKKAGGRLQVAGLRRAIRQVDPDIVHSRNWAAIEAVPAARSLRKPAVVHSEHGIESEAGSKQPFRRSVFRRVAFSLADRVVSVSYQLRDLHSAGTGFSKGRIEVIHNGVDCSRFRPDSDARARMRAELNLGEDDLCLGCVGNLLPVKDHLTLLSALSEFDADSKPWRFVLIGEGSERAKLEAFVSERPSLMGRVKFLGLRKNVSELLNAMDVYVLPSLFEGISNSLLEAMATALPVIATNVGGNPEVVTDGESGLLFPARDVRTLVSHLLRLDQQKDLRSRLSQEAERRVRQHFSIDSMVRKYDELYTGLISAPASLRVLAGA